MYLKVPVFCWLFLSIIVILTNAQENPNQQMACTEYNMANCNSCLSGNQNQQNSCERCVRRNNRCCFNPDLQYTVHPAVSFCRRDASTRVCTSYHVTNCIDCRMETNCVPCVLQNNRCCVNPLILNREMIAKQFCDENGMCTNYNINRCTSCLNRDNCQSCVLQPNNCCVNPMSPNRMTQAQQFCIQGRTCDFYNMNNCQSCLNRPGCETCVQNNNNCCFNPLNPMSPQNIKTFCQGSSHVCTHYNINNCQMCKTRPNCVQCTLRLDFCCINPLNPNSQRLANENCMGDGRTCTFYNINNCQYCLYSGIGCPGCVLNSDQCCVNPLNPSRFQLVAQYCSLRNRTQSSQQIN